MVHLVRNYRIYPTEPEQDTNLRKNIGCCRLVYNRSLKAKKDAYEKDGTVLSAIDLINMLPSWKKEEDKLWLAEADGQSLHQSIRDMDKAYSMFFKGFGFPKFKKKGVKDSFRTTGDRCRIEGNRIRISKHGWFVMHGGFAPPTDKIQSVTVKLEAGKWYAIVLYKDDTDYAIDKFERSACGIDVGVAKPITIVTEGMKGRHWGSKHKKTLARVEKRRMRMQRKLARKKKGSKNREKCKLRLQRLFVREANIRKDFCHKFSHQIATTRAVICVEDLNLKGMTKSAKGTVENPGKNVAAKSGLNRSMMRLGHGLLYRYLEYKCEKYGSTLVKVDPRFTSQECNHCGHTSRLNRKNQAKFRCIKCGHADNADLNAARNIMGRGLQQLQEAA
jgi:putative transposase